jgi:hypothetical protein
MRTEKLQVEIYEVENAETMLYSMRNEGGAVFVETR